MGILICYDRQPPENARTLAVKGARLLLVPSNGMWGGVNDSLLQTRAYENQCFLVWAHPRDGAVIDPGGRVIAASMTVISLQRIHCSERNLRINSPVLRKDLHYLVVKDEVVNSYEQLNCTIQLPPRKRLLCNGTGAWRSEHLLWRGPNAHLD